MKHNSKVIVKSNHPMFGNQIGYFQFFGEGKSKHIAILSLSPNEEKNYSRSTLFAVPRDDIKKLKE